MRFNKKIPAPACLISVRENKNNSALPAYYMDGRPILPGKSKTNVKNENSERTLKLGHDYTFCGEKTASVGELLQLRTFYLQLWNSFKAEDSIPCPLHLHVCGCSMLCLSCWFHIATSLVFLTGLKWV